MILLSQKMDLSFDLGNSLGDNSMDLLISPFLNNEINKMTFSFDGIQRPFIKPHCQKCEVNRKRTALIRNNNPMWSQCTPIFQQNQSNNDDSDCSQQIQQIFRSTSPCTSCENIDPIIFSTSQNYLDDDWLENTCNPDEICPLRSLSTNSSPLHTSSSILSPTLCQSSLSPSKQILKIERSFSDYGSDSNTEDIYSLLGDNILSGFDNYNLDEFNAYTSSSICYENNNIKAEPHDHHDIAHHSNEIDFVELWNSESGSDEEKVIDVESLDSEVVLPIYSTKSAQVAEMHNYSTNHGAHGPQCSLSSTSLASVNLNQYHHSFSSQSSIQSDRTSLRMKKHHQHSYNSHSDPPSPAYHPSHSLSSYKKSRKINNSKLMNSRRITNCTNNNKRRYHSEDTNKRAQHNVLERKRRSNLKDLFFCLRDVVPSMKGNGKFSKVSILENATSYINCINRDVQRLDDEWDKLKFEHTKLKAIFTSRNNFSP